MIKIIYGGGLLICLLIAVLFIQMAQTMDLNSRLIVEMKQMQVQLNTHEARIKGLAAEQAWIRESVRISAELK